MEGSINLLNFLFGFSSWNNSIFWLEHEHPASAISSQNMISWWNELTVQKTANAGFHETREFDGQKPAQSEILMKPWYLLLDLAVISIFAVCRFDTV